jgi:hypothetical protein
MTQRDDPARGHAADSPLGFRVQGRRTLYVDPCEALAALGVEETPEIRVAAAVMALEAARYYALALAMGGGPQAQRPAGGANSLGSARPRCSSADVAGRPETAPGSRGPRGPILHLGPPSREGTRDRIS